MTGWLSCFPHMGHSDMTPRELDVLDELVKREHDEYLRRSSIRFLECAIHLCASHMPMPSVADLLEEQAKQLREWG